MPGVILKGLSKRYGDVGAVDGLSLEVKPGELLALLGPSGCGKTTTLRLVAGFLAPEAGEIWVGDRCLSSPASVVPPERRRMAMIFQSYALWPHMTVAQNVAYGLRFKPGLSRGDREARVREGGGWRGSTGVPMGWRESPSRVIPSPTPTCGSAWRPRISRRARAWRCRSGRTRCGSARRAITRMAPTPSAAACGGRRFSAT